MKTDFRKPKPAPQPAPAKAAKKLAGSRRDEATIAEFEREGMGVAPKE